jgi:hypothetical protein
MVDNLGVVKQFHKSLNPAAVITVNSSSGFVKQALEPAQKTALDARCLWCDRIFSPRTTGGSTQKFCGSGHRQQFWIAARRWTMRAIEAGLLSVDCLKASHTSVHAARGAFRPQSYPDSRTLDPLGE